MAQPFTDVAEAKKIVINLTFRNPFMSTADSIVCQLCTIFRDEITLFVPLCWSLVKYPQAIALLN